MLGSRKPLNRSHIPGTLDAAPSGIDCSRAGVVQHLCNRPALAPVLKLLGHETARMTARTLSPHGAPSSMPTPVCCVRPPSGPRLDASLPREMENRPRGQADDAADDRWANICPAWRQSV